ncbi:MAG: M64 family metallopeptidase [Candidatus Cryptobacteroides sp.]
MRRTTAFLLVMALLFSCTEEESRKGGDISLSTDKIMIDADAGLGILDIDAESDWYIDGIPEWCGTVRPSMGKGGKTEVRIRGRFYYETADRQAELKVVSGDCEKTFKLIQTGKRIIEILPDCQRVPSNGGEISIAVNSSFEYEISIPETSSYVNVASPERPLAGNVRLRFDVNDGADRDAEIVFSDKTSSFEKVLVVPQDGDPYFQDRASLMALYENTEGGKWTASTGWGSNQSLGGWYGVTTGTVDGKTRVTGLDLSGNNLTGTLPESLSRLTALKSLVLRGNNLSGSIPQAVRDMPGWVGFSPKTNIFPQNEGYGFSYYDGEVTLLQQSDRPKGINVVFLCDGFKEDGLVYGGVFDNMVEEAVEGLFGTEPMKSYRNYFNVYSVASVSSDSGTGTLTARNTALGTYFTQSIGVTMNLNDTAAYGYVAKTGITDYPSTLVIVLVNYSSRLGGVTLSYNDGRTLTICTNAPADPTIGNTYGLAGLMRHEVVGHNLAKLDEEYVNQSGTVTDAFKSSLSLLHASGKSMNIDTTNDPDKVVWKHFIGLEGYEMVGCYEGAIFMDGGVWRPEQISCMVNNQAYFNAPSREQIVKRIKELAGESYSFEEFIANDKLRKL